MSLADELLADLEDDNDEEDELLEEIKKEPEAIEEDETRPPIGRRRGTHHNGREG